MPKVEVTVSSMNNISFVEKTVFVYDDEEWEDMDREQRQALIDEDAEGFMRETVQWDYIVLP